MTIAANQLANDSLRPCHGCHQPYQSCTCERRQSQVTYRLQCPYCWSEFRIPLPKKEGWIQRCGNCWRAFDAVVEG